MKKTYPLLFLILTTLYSCGDTSLTRTLPNVSGMSGEVLLVIDKPLWEGPVGETVRDYLAPVLIGFPREERAFSLISIPPAGFRDIFLVHRNVVMVRIVDTVDKASVSSLRNRWAETQLVMTIMAPDETSLNDFIKENSQYLRHTINEVERERLTSWLNSSAGKDRAVVVSGENKLSVPLPPGYKVDFNKDEVLMISAETPSTTQSLIISYDQPARAETNCIELADMTEKIMSKQVKGPDGNSYMVIEKTMKASCSAFKRNGNEYIELRGLWTLEGGFMGGPFVSYAYVDTVALRTVNVTAFVYAPKSEERELLRSLEALMYSVRKEN